ncbi:DUF2690 domain-containing protein [Lentzea sp. NPDC060358]|uniref:DUF2690 domain-containing protein n=1 Tax=Lentzea sp. NPDC060358 TaxID=3347103 RepID=UPI00364EDD17
MRSGKSVKSAIARVLLVLSVVVAGIVMGGNASAQAACNGAGCTGLDPQAQGCAATDLAGTSYLEWAGRNYSVVVRHSSACNARWARVFFDANPCCFTREVAVETQRLVGSNWVALDFRTVTIGAGQVGAYWTTMVANRSDDRVRACDRLTTSGWTCGNWAS